jgi:hypothetical protein
VFEATLSENPKPTTGRFRVLTKASYMEARCIANQEPLAKFGIVPKAVRRWHQQSSTELLIAALRFRRNQTFTFEAKILGAVIQRQKISLSNWTSSVQRS